MTPRSARVKASSTRAAVHAACCGAASPSWLRCHAVDDEAAALTVAGRVGSLARQWQVVMEKLSSWGRRTCQDDWPPALARC